MKSLVRTTTVVAAVGVFLLSGLPSEAQEATPTSPELKPLQRFIGSWDQQVVSKPAEWTPERTVMTCPSTVNWILSGRMVENKVASSTGENPALHLMTYDPKQKEYRQWYFDKNNLAPQGYRGNWDEATQTFTFTGIIADGVRATNQQKWLNKDTFTWTLVAKDRTGKVVLDMEGKCVRKK